DQGQDDGKTPAAAGQPDEPGNQVDNEDDGVDQAMSNSNATLTVDRLVPVGISGDGRAESGENTDENGDVGRRAPPLTAIEEIDDVEEDGERPGSERDVGDDGMERMAQPGAVHEGLQPVTRGTEHFIEATNHFLQEIGDRFQPALPVDKTVDGVTQHRQPPFPSPAFENSMALSVHVKPVGQTSESTFRIVEIALAETHPF